MPSDSIYIGASGMDAYQAQIDVVSNNIANVGTTGFKSQTVNFQDLIYQTQQPSSAPSKTNGGINSEEVGLGVKVGATDTNYTQGGVQTTGVNTNMMINGDGYFVLANSDGTGSPKYTRDGDFSLNENGLLYDPQTGLGVMGYKADSAGNIQNTGTPGPLQIPIGLKTQATATGAGAKSGPAGDKVFDMSYGGILDSGQFAAAVSNGAVSPANLTSAGTTIYDSLGNAHLVNMSFQPVLPQAGLAALPFQVQNTSGSAVTAATEWAFNVSSTDGTKFAGGATTSPTQYAFFDQNGQLINTSSVAAPAAGAVLGGANVHQAGGDPSLATGDQLTVTQWGVVPGADNSTTQSAAPGAIGIDLSGITSVGGTSDVQTTTQNGLAPGTLSNISVGQDGTITGAFTNGSSLALGQVALATFQNEAGLTRVGNTMFQTSSNSGVAQIGAGNSGQYGAVLGDSLELSNVSISDEFTKLITAQNAFTANSKSITTANQDDQTAIGLIR